MNLQRRHLDESQRALVAARLANLRDGQRADRARSANLPTCSQPQAASMLNVGERTVRNARVVLDKGSPELVRAVESGKVAVSVAAKIAALPEHDRAKVLADPRRPTRLTPQLPTPSCALRIMRERHHARTAPLAKISPRQRETVARLLARGVAVAKAAKRAGVSVTTVRKIGLAAGLLQPRPKKQPKPPGQPRPAVARWQTDLALSLLREGWTGRAVGDEVGISGSCAIKIARAANIPIHRRGPPKGSFGKPPQVKARALELVVGGATLREVGAAVGASHEAVNLWAKAAGVTSRRPSKAMSAARLRNRD